LTYRQHQKQKEKKKENTMEVELKVDDITAAHKAALKGKLKMLSKIK